MNIEAMEHGHVKAFYKPAKQGRRDARLWFEEPTRPRLELGKTSSQGQILLKGANLISIIL